MGFLGLSTAILPPLFGARIGPVSPSMELRLGFCKHSDVAALRKPKWYLLGTEGAIVSQWTEVKVRDLDPVTFIREEPIPVTETVPLLRLRRRHPLLHRVLPFLSPPGQHALRLLRDGARSDRRAQRPGPRPAASLDRRRRRSRGDTLRRRSRSAPCLRNAPRVRLPRAAHHGDAPRRLDSSPGELLALVRDGARRRQARRGIRELHGGQLRGRRPRHEPDLGESAPRKRDESLVGGAAGLGPCANR